MTNYVFSLPNNLTFLKTIIIDTSCFIYDIVLVTPLHRLYFEGPEFKSWGIDVGFWKGQDTASICSQLTTIPEKHWLMHPEECNSLLDRHFNAFLVSVETIIYGFLIYKIYKWFQQKYFPDPLIIELRALRDKIINQK